MKRHRKDQSSKLGAFEFFKRKKRKEEPKREIIRPEDIEILPSGYGPLAPRPEREIGPPRPAPRKPSMWEIFAPKPAKPKAPSIFEVFTPPPPPPPPPGKEERPWARQEPKPRPWYEQVVPEEERPGRKREIRVEEYLVPGQRRERREREERWQREDPEWERLIIPRQAYPVGRWQPPSISEMARHLERILPLNEIFREVSEIIRSQEWQEDLESESRRGRFAIAFLRPVTTRELWTDLAAFFNVPFEVVESYYANARTAREEAKAEKAIWEQLFNPLIDTMTQAFARLKPKGLPGFFNLVPYPVVTSEGRVILPDPPEYWLAYQDSLVGPSKLEFR